MLKLIDVNEKNWLSFANLGIAEEQKTFLGSAIGIVARGYVYRFHRAKVIGIVNDANAIGLALVRDLEEEPACYDLQQFMIDARYQGKGFGAAALKMILSDLRKEHKYNCVEVCVKKNNCAALRLYKKMGFIDSGYIDEDVPDCLHLMYHFEEERLQHLTRPTHRD